MPLVSCPRLLVLALAFPELSHALGLGDMRVESRLNEPLSAQIDIIGATPDELQAIRASVGSPELFERYNAERPAFLSSATISVGTDATGKPVLNIRSTATFTEPVVEFLIDLRYNGQRLVRDYSLLLDPARVAPATSSSVNAVPNDFSTLLVQMPPIQFPEIVLAPIVVPEDPVPAGTASAVPTLYRVSDRDTLRAIVIRAGAHSAAERQRMMRSIYQANPQAFAGNINRLRSGALLSIPSTVAEPVVVASVVAAPVVAAPKPLPAPTPIRQGTDPPSLLPAVNKLTGQVQFLQQTLDETSRQLDRAHARIGEMERYARSQATVARQSKAEPRSSFTSGGFLGATFGALALLAGGLAYAWRRLRPAESLRRGPVVALEPTVEEPVPDIAALVPDNTSLDSTSSQPDSVVAADAPESDDVSQHAVAEATAEVLQVADIAVDTVEQPALGYEPDTVVMETLEGEATSATGTVLDFNLANLDGRAQHVEMPGTLRDQAVLVERRKNIVDTLMAAIKRDPTRSDLRMRLLEALHTAAATNLRIFNEVVRDLVQHPELLDAAEWQQVLEMGRQIAPQEPVFADQTADKDVADCA